MVITGAGAPGTLEIIRSLDRAGGYELVGADANYFSAGFPLVQRHYLLPFAVDPSFRRAMLNVLTREQPDFVIPLVDEEIPVVHELVVEGFPNTRVVTPRLEFAVMAMDKWAMALALAEAGLSTAKTWLASDAQACSYPAIVKPRSGRGSRGFSPLAGPDDLARYLESAGAPADRFIVQERLTGKEFTTSVVCTLAGRVLAVVPKEAVDKRGITRVGATRREPAIDMLCRDISERLQPNGPFNVQLMLCPDGVPKVFEINPRYSTSTALTIAAGVNEVDLVLQSALGEDVEVPEYKVDLMMIRHETQFYVDEVSWHPPLAKDLG